ncbi:hypothetical protein ACHAXT_005480 [Thalassiosira profunda]
MPASAALARSKFLTLSFSGAGHLLPYHHLGVAIAIKSNQASIAKPIKAVPDPVPAPLQRAPLSALTKIASGRGRAMHHFKDMMRENQSNGDGGGEHNTNLHIATTRCSDGSSHCSTSITHTIYHPEEELLLKCLEASCKIPAHFHPADVLPSRWPATYPEEDGIFSIDGSAYVDGGISAPAPPTPLDAEEGACRVVISPISGSSDESLVRISPRDNSWKLPFDIKCRGEFKLHASIQNFQALQIAGGVASTPMLQEWFERGTEDATRALLR